MRLKTRIVIAAAAMLASFANFAEDSGIGMNIVPAPKKVVIDGNLNDWTLTAPVNYCVDPNSFDQRVKTYAMWDEQNLYLAYEVRDTSPLKNNGSDPTSAFKTGDSMHFYLSTDREVSVDLVHGLRLLHAEQNVTEFPQTCEFGSFLIDRGHVDS